MNQYNYENLHQIIGEKVVIKDDHGNAMELEVAEVCKGKLDGDEWESFSVVFRGAEGDSAPQGTYTFSHKKFGDESLFLSPNSETEYETIVTRKRSDAA